MKKPNFSTDRIINSPAAAVFVAGLISLLSHINNNLFTYSYTQVFVSLATQVAVSLFAALIIVQVCRARGRIYSWLQTHFQKVHSTQPAWISNRLLLWLAQLHWVDALALAVVLAWMQLTPPIYQLQVLVLKTCPILLATVKIKTLLTIAGILVLSKGIRPFNLILLPLFLVILSTFPFVLAKELFDPGPKVDSSEPKVTFKTRPNVFLFFLESYDSKESMRRFFDIDAEPFYQELERLGYMANDTYSSRTYTMGSAATLMLMRHFSAKDWSAGNWDVKKSMHKMFSGCTRNPVIDQFKHNGYQIAFFHRSGYLYRVKSPAIDATNLDAGFTGLQFYMAPIVAAFLPESNALQGRAKPLLETIKPDIRRQLDRGYPTFFFIYSGLEHIGNEPKEEFPHHYRQAYQDFTPKFLSLLEFIKQQDPRSIVILIGDHGAQVYGMHKFTEKKLGASGYSPELIAQDAASVFFAIKNPVKNDVSQEVMKRPITHVNLFRYLFAILADDRSLLDKAEPDITQYVDDSIIARDNQPLKQWDRPKSRAQ